MAPLPGPTKEGAIRTRVRERRGGLCFLPAGDASGREPPGVRCAGEETRTSGLTRGEGEATIRDQILLGGTPCVRQRHTGAGQGADDDPVRVHRWLGLRVLQEARGQRADLRHPRHGATLGGGEALRLQERGGRGGRRQGPRRRVPRRERRWAA